MIYVETDNGNRVIKIISNSELLTSSQKTNGFFLDYVSLNTIPQPQYVQGKVAKMKASEEQGIWYEYEEDIIAQQENIENKINSLDNQVLQVQQYIVDKEIEELLNQGGM